MIAAPIWHSFMNYVLAKYPKESFTLPASLQPPPEETNTQTPVDPNNPQNPLENNSQSNPQPSN
jgi:membrane carboxypeptidase/penicillin-binding protein